MLGKINFTGIIKPYERNGYKIVPISADPSEKDIRAAIFATKIKKPHSGMNGRAYFYGEDLVVKKYMNEKEAFNYDPSREIKALDMLFDKNIVDSNIQLGMYAFTTPQNDTYLVSTRIKGHEANPKSNPYNKENLSALVKTLGILDMPVENENITGNFPYEVPMHFDLYSENFNIDKNSAGIFDFEHTRMFDLQKEIARLERGDNWCVVDEADIAGFVSNLRNFEYKSFLPYLMSLNSSQAQELFNEYLNIKSSYHFKRAEFFKSESLKSYKTPEQKEKLEELSEKEKAHGICLSKENLNPDVIRAEAMKIQLACFAFDQTIYSSKKINPKQIKEYVKKADLIFNRLPSFYTDSNFKIYFQDCLDLMNNWRGIINSIEMQEKYPQVIYGKDKTERLDLTGKTTNEVFATLDEKISLNFI